MSLLDWINPASWVTSAVTAIGGTVAKTVVSYHKDSLDAGNTFERIQADIALRELAVEEKEAEVNSKVRTDMIGHWHEPVQLLGYIMVIYVGKVIVWDIVLGLGTTDPIRGAVGEWAGAIILALIGKRTFETVTKILRR